MAPTTDGATVASMDLSMNSSSVTAERDTVKVSEDVAPGEVIIQLQHLLTPNTKVLRYFGILYFTIIVLLKTAEYLTFCIVYLFNNIPYLILLFAFYLLLAAMAFWSFATVFFSERTPVPPRFKLSADERASIEPHLPTLVHPNVAFSLRTMAKQRGVRTVNRSMCVNFCDQCNLIKPDRTHHCHRCKACVLRMDHHCPFFNRCIEYHLHKAFMLTLLYSTLGCLYTLISQLIIRTYVDLETHSAINCIVISSIICDACGVLFLGAFFINQVYNACTNRTSVSFAQHFMDEPNDSYNLGSILENLYEVLGSPRYWLIPTRPSGDGVTWRTKNRLEPSTKQVDVV